MKFLKLLAMLTLCTYAWGKDSYIDHLDTTILASVAQLPDTDQDTKNFAHRVLALTCYTLDDYQHIDHFLGKYSAIYTFVDYFEKATVCKNLDTIELRKSLRYALGEKLYVHYLRCSKQAVMSKIRLLRQALDYWKKEKFYNDLPLYKKGFMRLFFSAKYYERVVTCVEHMQEILEHLYAFLGLIRSHEDILEQAKTHEELVTCLVQANKDQHNFLYKNEQAIVEKDDQDDIAMLLTMSLTHVQDFMKEIEAHYQICQIPNHFQRNGDRYMLAAVAVVAGLYIQQHHQDTALQGVNYFYNAHVKGALDRSYKTFLQGFQGPQLNYSAEEKNAEAMMDSLLGKRAPRTSGNAIFGFLEDLNDYSDGVPWQVVENFKENSAVCWGNNISKALSNTWYVLTTTINDMGKDLVEKAAQAKAMKLQEQEQQHVYDPSQYSFKEKTQASLERITTIKAHKGLNAFDVLDAYSLQGELKLVEIQALLNRYFQDVHATFSVFALIPFGMFATGTILAGNKMYQNFVNEPLKGYVRNLNITLNTALYKNKIYEYDGQIYFFTQELLAYISLLNLEEQQMMQEDIAQLQSSKLTYEQKYHVLERMYRSYSFLNK